MGKRTWKVYTVATCRDCGKHSITIKMAKKILPNTQKKYKHVVVGEVGLAFIYDGNN